MSTCKVCGCTDQQACPGGCYWVDNKHSVCSTCYDNIMQAIDTGEKAVLFKEDGSVGYLSPKAKYFTLKELQAAVKGLIEIYPASYRNRLIVCNEEGIIRGFKINTTFKLITGIGLLGDVLLCPTEIFEEPEDENI